MKRLRRSTAESLAAIQAGGIRIEFDDDGDVFSAYQVGSVRAFHKGTIASFVRQGWVGRTASIQPDGRRIVVDIGDYAITNAGRAALG